MGEELPSEINVEFIQGVLRRSEQDDTIEVIDMNSKSATAKGDNFCSDLYRIFVEFTRKKLDKKITEKKSMILKLSPRDEGSRRDLVEKTGLFDVEMNIMTKTLEKMNEIVGKNHRFNAVAYYVQRKYPAFLLLEDLTALGFTMAHRHTGFDLDHCLLVMRNMARFHASSAVLCQREPIHIKYSRNYLYEDNPDDGFREYFTGSLNALADEVENWPELGPSYSKKLRVLAEKGYAKGKKCVEVIDGEFNIINHGDSWVNNMLFRYNDEGKPIDHIYVDFQMSIYGSPALDLHYFLSTSVAPNIYDKSKEFLLEEYLRTLTSCLKEYGYEGQAPTMSVIHKYLEDREYFAFVSAVASLPLVLMDKDKAVSMDDMLKEEGSVQNPGFKSEAYRKAMIKRLPYFDKLGVLDC